MKLHEKLETVACLNRRYRHTDVNDNPTAPRLVALLNEFKYACAALERIATWGGVILDGLRLRGNRRTLDAGISHDWERSPIRIPRSDRC